MESIREINKVQTETVALSLPAVKTELYEKTVTLFLLAAGCI